MILWSLFIAYFQIAAMSFGGGYAAIPLIQAQIVEQHQWLTMSQFADLISIAEMTPGPLILNSATFVGQQMAGIPGAVVCTMGSILPPFLIVLVLSWFYMKYRSLKYMQGVLAGLRPVVVALIASAALSLLALALFDAGVSEIRPENFRWIEALLFIIALVLLRTKKAGPVTVIFGSGIAGLILYIMKPV